MVIQSNMTPKAIIDVWEETTEVFKKYKIPLTSVSLETLVDSDLLPSLLQALNTAVGSSNQTCIEGGWQMPSYKK